MSSAKGSLSSILTLLLMVPVFASWGGLRAFSQDLPVVQYPPGVVRRMPVMSAAFSPDGKHLVSGNLAKHVIVWDAATGKLVRELEGQHSYSYSVAYSPDGKLIAGSDEDGAVHLWNATTGVLIKDLQGPGAGIETIAFSHDGKLLAGGDDDGNVLIWSIDSALQVMAVSAANQVIAVKFSKDGKRLVSLTSGSLDVWSVPDGKKLSESLSGPSHSFMAMALSPNGDYLAVSSRESSPSGLKIRDKVSLRTIESAGILKSFDSGSGLITALTFDPTGAVLAGASIGGNVIKWATVDGRFSELIKIDPLATEDERYYLINSIAFDPLGKKIVIARGSFGLQDGSLSVWDSATGSKLMSLEAPAEETAAPSESANLPKIGDPKSSPTQTPKAADSGKELVYSGRTVATKARVLSKPEPQYTERARVQRVTGTVVLKAVLSSRGEMTDIHVLVQLPFGLTSAAVRAAKGIKFTPATKDGKDVSQYIQIEYNFDLF